MKNYLNFYDIFRDNDSWMIHNTEYYLNSFIVRHGWGGNTGHYSCCLKQKDNVFCGGYIYIYDIVVCVCDIINN